MWGPYHNVYRGHVFPLCSKQTGGTRWSRSSDSNYDYLAVTNHRAGGVLYVQEEDDFDRDHPCCLPESLARVNVDRVLDTYRVFLLDAI